MRGTMGRCVPFFRAAMCIHVQSVEETTGGLSVPTQRQMLLVGQQQTDPVLQRSTLHASSIGLSDCYIYIMLFVLTDCFAVAIHCVADCDGVLLFIFC